MIFWYVRGFFLFFNASYKFISMSSKTKASFPKIMKTSTRGFVIQRFDHFDYVLMGWQNVKCLDLFKLFDFLQRIELFLHAFYCNIFSAFKRQSSKDDWKCTATFFILKFVLIHLVIVFLSINKNKCAISYIEFIEFLSYCFYLILNSIVVF